MQVVHQNTLYTCPTPLQVGTDGAKVVIFWHSKLVGLTMIKQESQQLIFNCQNMSSGVLEKDDKLH